MVEAKAQSTKVIFYIYGRQMENVTSSPWLRDANCPDGSTYTLTHKDQSDP